MLEKFLNKKNVKIGALGLGIAASTLAGNKVEGQTKDKDTIGIETKVNKDSVKKEIKPDDYYLIKMGALNLMNLDAKKALDSETIKRLMTEVLERTKETKEAKEEYLESSLELFKEIERARGEAEHLISQESYLDKLQSEFNCSKEEAIRHQQVRLSNINIANYVVVDMEYIRKFTLTGLAFAEENTNMMVFPYDYKKYTSMPIFEIALHEFLHISTNCENGLSNQTIDLLTKKSFNYVDNSKLEQYFSNETERYARFKILQSELQKLGIYKLGEEFTREHYNKILELSIPNKLSKDADDFVMYTKGFNSEKGYKIFKQMFDKIASVDSLKDYKFPGWNYDDKNKT